MATTDTPQPLDVFYSYAHEDKVLVKDLIAALSGLRREGAIKNLFDCEIVPGEEWDAVIRQQLDTAEIILLCVSSDFLNSDYIYSVELQAAMDRHQAGTATVIPIIIRSVDWGGAAFAKLQALPSEGKAVTQLAKPGRGLHRRSQRRAESDRSASGNSPLAGPRVANRKSTLISSG